MDKLPMYRKLIDESDDKIIAALVDRFTVARNIGLYKQELDMPVYSEAREKQILNKLEQYPYAGALKSIYAIILEQSRKIQK